jgi:hypothetical protein
MENPTEDCDGANECGTCSYFLTIQAHSFETNTQMTIYASPDLDYSHPATPHLQE